MPSGSLQVALLSALLLWGSIDPARATSASNEPAEERAAGAGQDPAARTRSAQPHRDASGASSRAQAARDFAFSYLELWSSPNPVTFASTASLYRPYVIFHGRGRTLGAVLAEKRRFAERWPDRDYRYRPETTQVACEAGRAQCTVWSIFDFSASHGRQGRRSVGTGEHELVLSFAEGKPVISSETSRVLRRGAPRPTTGL